jgi:hypothetical protein
MGHYILMKSLNSMVHLKTTYPYTGDWAKLHASVLILIAVFFEASISCITSLTH